VIGLLQPQQSWTFTATGSVKCGIAPGSLATLVASLVAPAGDSNLANNSASTTVTTVNSADLAIGVSKGPNTVKNGVQITYTFTVQNNGPNAATQVVFNNVFSSGLNLLRLTSPQLSCEFSFCDLGTLAANATAQVNATYQVTGAAKSTVTTTGAVTACTYDPVSSNNSAMTNVKVTP
jgi:uncharacterized repeat protein (TIGR01451 family)